MAEPGEGAEGRQRPRLRLVPHQEGFSGLAGPFYEIHLADSGWRRALLLEPRHLNAQGVIHGGLLSTFADLVLHRAITDELGFDTPCSTVQLNLQFLAAARAGRWLYGEGLVLRRTRSLLFVTGELFDDDRQVALATGIWKLIGRN